MARRRGCYPAKKDQRLCWEYFTRAHPTHLDCLILYPRLLRSIGYSTRTRKTVERVRARRYVVHLAKKRHQQRALARACRTDDEVDFPLPEEQVTVDAQVEVPSASARCGSS